MEIGKLTNEQLNKIIFSKIKYKDPKVLVGSGIGEDCSILDFKDELCVISTDPITATNSSVGELAVHVSCNDIAAKGVKPFAIMLTLLAPPSATLGDIEDIISDVLEVSNEFNIQLIGGHTEVTDAVNRIVLSVTCLGSGSRDMLIENSPIEPGDYLLMTKYAGCEGTTIIYEDFYDEIKGILDEEDSEQYQNLKGSLSVIKEGLLAGKAGAKLMHDATEGGILGAAWEIVEKANVGITIMEENIPILPLTVKISKYFNINPLKLISSGVMLIAVGKEKKDDVIKILKDEGIKVSVIGHFSDHSSEIIIKNKEKVNLLPPETDELYKVYKATSKK